MQKAQGLTTAFKDIQPVKTSSIDTQMGQISLFALYTGLESVASHDNNFGYEKLGYIDIYDSGASDMSDMSEQICRKFGPFVKTV